VNVEQPALYVKSQLPGMAGQRVAKLTRRKEKLTVHSTYEAAMQHLIKLSDQR
jgi:hypothetical protein